MAGGAGSDRKRSTEDHLTTAVPDEELRRTLERDTAVQGEREEEAARTSGSPAGADNAPAPVRPTRVRKNPPK